MTRGTAPVMTPDLREVIDRVASARPDVEWWQLQVKWPADDDGLWFFRTRGARFSEVKIESSRGVCPFLIEGDDDERRYGQTPAEVADIVLSLLPAPTGDE